MSLSHEVSVPVLLNGDVSLLIYAPNDLQIDIESVKLVPAASVAKDAVNFTEISLRDKGVGGAEDNEITGTIVETSVATGIALTANVKQDMSPSSFFTSGNAIMIVKEDNGSAVNLGLCVLIMKVRSK